MLWLTQPAQLTLNQDAVMPQNKCGTIEKETETTESSRACINMFVQAYEFSIDMIIDLIFSDIKYSIFVIYSMLFVLKHDVSQYVLINYIYIIIENV